jgi:predicted phage tail protein
MAPKLVYLHGPLAKSFGPGPWKFKANNLRELFAGLTMLHPTFRRELIKHQDLCVMKVKGEKVAFLTENELAFNFGDYEELHVGVGKVGNVAEGAAATAAYFFAQGTTAYYIAYAVAYVAITAAISYAISTVITSLADVPASDEAAKKQQTSSLFNGPENRDAQGGRVQLIYGRFLAGSYTLSQNIEARRQAIGIDNSLAVETGSSAGMNVFSNDFGLVNPAVADFVIDGVTRAPGTYALTGYTITVASNGDLTFAPTSDNLTITVLLNCTSTANNFDQTTVLTSVPVYVPYDHG